MFNFRHLNIFYKITIIFENTKFSRKFGPWFYDFITSDSKLIWKVEVEHRKILVFLDDTNWSLQYNNYADKKEIRYQGKGCLENMFDRFTS